MTQPGDDRFPVDGARTGGCSLSTTIRLNPPVGVDDVAIGSSRGDARRALAGYGAVESFSRAGEQPGWRAHNAAETLVVFTYFDAADSVEAIETGRPADGSSVLYGDLDVFAISAQDVVRALRRHTPVAGTQDETSYVAADLLLSFWRSAAPESPGDEEGRYFDSVLVARPGYYGN